MKARLIRYEKCFNLGNFQNEKVGIEIEVEEGEKAEDVLAKAKAFVERSNPEILRSLLEYERAKTIAENPNRYLYEEVMHANDLIAKIDGMKEDLPF